VPILAAPGFEQSRGRFHRSRVDQPASLSGQLKFFNPSFSNGRLKMAKLRFFLHVSWFEFLQVTHFQRPDFSTDAV
jgi:hypothetical protein